MRHGALMGVLLIVSIASAHAQPPSAPSPSSAPSDPTTAELAKLNATLREIVDLMKKQGETAALDLFLKRVQLAEKRLAEAELALRGAESERRSLQEERGRIEVQLRLTAAAAQRGDREQPPEQAAAYRQQLEMDMLRIRQRLSDLANEIATLESETTTQRAELDSWQAQLDRRLGRY